VLTENDVIAAVCSELARIGWMTRSTATTRQRGDDIVATKGGRSLLVEAKGGTSSKEGTARFGVDFNAGQVRTHVAVAVLRAMRVVSTNNAVAGLAFPDNARHRHEVEAVQEALDRLGIVVFWVGAHRGVTIEGSLP
jgi:hypothetical protein